MGERMNFETADGSLVYIGEGVIKNAIIMLRKLS